MRFGNLRLVIEDQGLPVLKRPASVPAVSFWPEGKRRQVRRSAYCGPGIGVRAVLECSAIDFLCKVDKQRPIGAQIRTPIIYLSVELLAWFKDIRIRIPLDDLDPIGRTSAEDNRCGRFSRKEDRDASGDSPSLALLGYFHVFHVSLRCDRLNCYFPNWLTKKSAMVWLASMASGRRGSYQKAWGRASKTTRRASTPALR